MNARRHNRDAMPSKPWAQCLCTLDGEPARIRPAHDHGFVLVSRADGRGGDVEFSATTARRVLANNANFKS